MRFWVYKYGLHPKSGVLPFSRRSPTVLILERLAPYVLDMRPSQAVIDTVHDHLFSERNLLRPRGALCTDIQNSILYTKGSCMFREFRPRESFPVFQRFVVLEPLVQAVLLPETLHHRRYSFPTVE